MLTGCLGQQWALASHLLPPICWGWVFTWLGWKPSTGSINCQGSPPILRHSSAAANTSRGVTTGEHVGPRPKMYPPLPQSTDGIFKHTTALREDYDNSYKAVRANIAHNPLSSGQYLSLYCYFFFSALFMQGSALNLNDCKTIPFLSQLRWMLWQVKL